MDVLEAEDIRRIIQMLGRAAGMTEPLNERRRYVLEQLAELVEADLWMWVQSRRGENGDLAAYAVLDGGLRDDEDRGRLVVAANDPLHMQLMQRTVDISRHATLLTQDWMRTAQPAERPTANTTLERSRIAGSVISIYPIDDQRISAIGLHRREGRAQFGDRERTIVHLVFSQVDWLHCIEDTAGGGDGSALMSLSNRQRQTLVLLLGGSSPKQIAVALQISEYTVRDYIKQIYRRFDVSGRGELLSLFINGGHRLPAP